MTEPPLLELSGITKIYPGVVALDDVSFALGAGEVVGLIGENGAGKSTLMKVLGGVVAPSAGRIRIGGVEWAGLTVQQSMAAGIAFVHQELNLFDNLDVAANVFLGRELRRGVLGLVDNAAMAAAVQPILARLGATFRPDTPVQRLSLAERQLLEIAKALSLDARIVIMDEPTSSLTIAETKRLLAVIADLKAHGIAVIFISHRLNEVEECADRVVVLRDGRVAGALSRGEIAHDTMIRLMIGRDLKALYDPPRVARGDPVLQIQGLRTQANPHAAVDLDVHAGEILGLAGLVGAGRTELARAAFGIDPSRGGAIVLGGRRLAGHSPDEAIAAGLFLVPEDRKQSGLVLDFTIMANIALPDLPSLARGGLVQRRLERERADAQRKRLAIKTPDVLRLANELSGGNQQKIVLAKWLAMAPKAIIFDEPTRGIDVGAKTEIYRLMRGLADAGVAVLMISSDMEEVIGVSDRIAVMHSGAIAGELARGDFSEHNVLTLAVGNGPAPGARAAAMAGG
ncbi:MAG: sugar ABC transporter ATP-binding protein [Alphaproteobacteria bacterium]